MTEQNSIFYQSLLEALKPKILELQNHNIRIGRFPQMDAAELDYLALFASLEQTGRSQQKTIHASLEELEKTHFGHDVGAIRRYFNALLEAELDWKGSFLDFGCGGPWWKDSYWPKFSRVHAVEVVPSTLLELRKSYPDPERYDLSFSTTGLTPYESETFDQVLSSSVLGYITPRQARHHLRECWRVLKPGGRLFLTRIKASNYQTLKRGKFFEVPNRLGGFEFSYSKKDLRSLIAETCPGAKIELERRMGFTLPMIPFRWIQSLFHLGTNSAMKSDPRPIAKIGPITDKIMTTLFPFLTLHHFWIIRKL